MMCHVGGQSQTRPTSQPAALVVVHCPATSATPSQSSSSAPFKPARTAASAICVTTRLATAAAGRVQTCRGRTVNVPASALLGAVHRSSVTATVSLSISLLPSPSLTRSRQPHYLRLSRNNNLKMTTTRPMCLLSLIPPPSHRLYLVCVEKLAASMMARMCVLAHKLTHTPRLVRPTVSPLPLSLTVG